MLWLPIWKSITYVLILYFFASKAIKSHSYLIYFINNIYYNIYKVIYYNYILALKIFCTDCTNQKKYDKK